MILIVLPWSLALPGGVNEVVKNLLHEYGERDGLRTQVLVCDWTARTLEPCEPGPTWDCFRLRVREPLQRTGVLRSLLSYAVETPRTMLQLRALLTRRGTVVVNVHFPTTATLTFALMRALRLCPARLVLTFHGSDAYEAASAHRLSRWGWRAVIRWSDAISTVSASLRATLIGAYPSASEKTSVIPNGLNPERLKEERRQWASAGGPAVEVGGRFILSVGTYAPVKGQATLLRAFARVAGRIEPARLVIAGRHGPSLDAIRALVAELRLADRVTLLVDEPHPRVMDLYDRAEMLVLPSLREGLPLVLLEAGCMGCPVLATRVGGIPELIEPERDGLLVDPEDPVALAEGIERLWSDPILARRLGAALQRKVRERYTWERAARQYLSLMGVGAETPVAVPGDVR